MSEQELLFKAAGESPTLEGLAAKKEKLRAQIEEEGKAAIATHFRDFFINHGHIISEIHWYQFTPNWSDGDQCFFSYESFVDSEGFEYVDEDTKPHPSDTPEGEAAYTAMNKLDDQLDSQEDLLEWIFGDHVTVKVTASGVVSSPYTDHH